MEADTRAHEGHSDIKRPDALMSEPLVGRGVNQELPGRPLKITFHCTQKRTQAPVAMFQFHSLQSPFRLIERPSTNQSERQFINFCLHTWNNLFSHIHIQHTHFHLLTSINNTHSHLLTSTHTSPSDPLFSIPFQNVSALVVQSLRH